MHHKSREYSHMNNCVALSPNQEIQNLFREIMKSHGALSIKEGIRAITRHTGLTETRAKDLWHGRGCVKSEEMDIARRAAKKEKENDATLLQRLDRIESLLASLLSIDPEFYGQDVSAYRQSIDAVRGATSAQSTRDLA